MDPRQPVRPGQRMDIAAAQVNFLNQMMAGNPLPQAGGLPGWEFGNTQVLVKNTTATAIDRWGVLAISGIEINPNGGTRQRVEFESMPCLSGAATSSSTGDKFVVALEPIKAGKIGRAAIAGVVQIKSADLSKAVGSVTLWTDGDWALIRIGAGSPVRVGKTTAAWDKGTLATITLYEEGDPPSEHAASPATTLAGCVNKTQNVPSGKFVIVAKAANGHWYLVDAECG